MTSAKNRSTLLLATLAATYCLAYVDRLMMAVVAEPVKAEFGLSDAQLFLLTGAAFVLIYGMFGMLSGWLLDRFNRNLIIAVSLAFWSLFTVACGMAKTFPQLAVARAGVGIGESAIVPAAMALISDNYPPEHRPLAMGIFYAGGMVGIFLAWVVGGWLAGEYGWRAAFFLAGPPGVLLALLILWKGGEIGRERPAQATKLDAPTFRDVWRNTPLMWLIFAASLGTFVNVGLVNMLGSFFIRSHRMSVSEVGLIFGPVLAGGMALGLIGGGWIGNQLARHGVDALIRFSAWNTLALFPIYLALLMAPTQELALIATFIGAGVSVLYSPCYSAAYQAICAPHTRSTAAGISGCANAVIGGALATFLVGALSDRWKPIHGANSLKYAMMVGLVCSLLSGAMFIYARKLVARTDVDAHLAAAAPSSG